MQWAWSDSPAPCRSLCTARWSQPSLGVYTFNFINLITRTHSIHNLNKKLGERSQLSRVLSFVRVGLGYNLYVKVVDEPHRTFANLGPYQTTSGSWCFFVRTFYMQTEGTFSLQTAQGKALGAPSIIHQTIGSHQTANLGPEERNKADPEAKERIRRKGEWQQARKSGAAQRWEGTAQYRPDSSLQILKHKNGIANRRASSSPPLILHNLPYISFLVWEMEGGYIIILMSFLDLIDEKYIQHNPERRR